MVKYFSDIYNSTTAILSGMFLTINHLFRAKKGIATLQYPEERWPDCMLISMIVLDV